MERERVYMRNIICFVRNRSQLNDIQDYCPVFFAHINQKSEKFFLANVTKCAMIFISKIFHKDKSLYFPIFVTGSVASFIFIK